MENEKPRRFSRDLGLLLCGAAIALISSLITGYVTYQLGLNRLLYEQKSDSFREYSKAFNTFFQDIERAIEASDEQSSLLRTAPNVNREQAAALTKDFSELQNKVDADVGAINAQVFVLNAVFREQVKQLDQKELTVGLNLGPIDTPERMERASIATREIMAKKLSSWRLRFLDDAQRLSKEFSLKEEPAYLWFR